MGMLILEMPSFPAVPANLPGLYPGPVGHEHFYLCRRGRVRGDIRGAGEGGEERVWKTQDWGAGFGGISPCFCFARRKGRRTRERERGSFAPGYGPLPVLTPLSDWGCL